MTRPCFVETKRKCESPSPHSSRSSSFSLSASSSSPESKDPFRNHLTCPIPGCAKQRSKITTMRSHLRKVHQKGKGPPIEWLVSTESKLCPKSRFTSAADEVTELLLGPKSVRQKRQRLQVPCSHD